MTITMRPYEIFVPAGWLEVRLGESYEEDIKKAATSFSADLPERPRIQARAQLESALREALGGLDDLGMVAAYLPGENPMNATTFPIVTIRPLLIDLEAEELSPMEYLIAQMSLGGYEVFEAGNMVGIKKQTDDGGGGEFNTSVTEFSESIVDALDQSEDEPMPRIDWMQRQLEYTVGVPTTNDCWMQVLATIGAPNTEGGLELLDSVTEFLDVWLGTVSWADE